MSATLRFPFQASLDGSSLVESDGNFYYGLDAAHVFEMQAAESDTESEADAESEQTASMDSVQQANRPVTYILDDEPVTTSRPVSMMPHRIYTSDQQRFATEHEMAAEETETDEAESAYCESPTSTIEPPEEKQPRRNGPPRFYSTPIVEGDPTSTPVLLYGLEQPSEHIPRPKKLSRSRNYHSAAPVRPSSRHGPSPLSWEVQPGIPEESDFSSRRISMLFRRASMHLTQSTYIPSKAERPAVDSTCSSSTTSTVRSMATAAEDDSTTPASSTSASPTLEAVPSREEKPDPSPSLSSTDHIQDTQPDPSSFSPSLPPSPRPVRRRATSIMTSISDNASVSSRRMSIFNFRFRKSSFMRSNETLSTIRAEAPPPTASASTESPSKPMPYSPDSFESPHTQTGRGRTMHRKPLDNDTNDNTNDTTSPDTIRPHTSYNPATAPARTSYSTIPRAVRNFSKPRNFPAKLQPSPLGQSEMSKQRKANRATRFFSRIFISDNNN
jgi:hypothetical protein